MATSGIVGYVPLNTRSVIDLAHLRATIPLQKITPEMMGTAKDLLQLILSDMGNRNIPSWCIEKVLLPMYQGNPVVPLPQGTVSPLDVNYRTISELEADALPTPATSFVYAAQNVSTAGIKWNAASVAVTFSVGPSSIGPWETVGTLDELNVSGEWAWTDVLIPDPANTHFRVSAATNINAQIIYLGGEPQNIPMGVINRDQYSYQSNQVFPSQPTQYWFQRNYPIPQINIWPAPNGAAEVAQIVMWVQRNIMDVGTYQQNIEVPRQWNEAVIADLAHRIALSTPTVPLDRVQYLEGQAEKAMNKAWDGDGDGAPSQIMCDMTPYTA